MDTSSLDSGDSPATFSPALDRAGSLEDGEVSPLESSNLEVFSQAKVDAGMVCHNLAAVLEDLLSFLQESVAYDESGEPVKHLVAMVGDRSEQHNIERLRERALMIKEAVSRNYMKVVFIGRTSAGKSTTINAMLQARVLPSGSGHTTNCFCVVQGTGETKPYLIAPTSQDRRPISEVDHLADALSKSGRLETEAMVDIFWPTEHCTLLRHDVVFVDSPGLDISHDTDRWIDRHCTDADVFVLVSNFESSLSRTEVGFFQRVVSKLCKPNIFVLFNRWDAFDEEENFGKDVPGQHRRAAEDFLVRELSLQTVQQLPERVFFVSSKEALLRRMRRATKPTPDMDTRFREFQRFENSFEECISRSALVTRFKKHVVSGQEACKVAEDTLAQAAQRLDEYSSVMDECIATHRAALARLEAGWHEVDARAQATVRRAQAVSREAIVASVVVEVHGGLQRAISLFSHPSFKEGRLDEYKQHLDEFLNQQLRDPTNARFREAASASYRSLLQELLSAANEVLPRSQTVVSSQGGYEATLSIDCAALTQGFRPDMGFRFSYGIERLAPQLYSSVAGGVKCLNPVNWPSLLRSHETRRAALFDAMHSAFAIANHPVVVAATPVAYWLLRKHYRLCLYLGGMYAAVYVAEFVSYSMANHEDEYKTKYAERLRAQLENHVQWSAGNTSQGIQESLRTNHTTLAATALAKTASLKHEIDTGVERQALLATARAKAAKLREGVQGVYEGFCNFMGKYITPFESTP